MIRGAQRLSIFGCSVALSLSGCAFQGVNSLPLPGAVGRGPDAVTYHVEIPNVATLESNSPVMIDNVIVGSVGEMNVQDWHASVDISVKPDVVVPANAVATVGPVAISVDAGWMMYEEGVYSSACGSTIDHAVGLVGYGSDNGEDYWLVRNSWGSGWGEKGYIRIKRFGEGKEPCKTDTKPGEGTGCKGGPSTMQVCGLCGIMSDSSYVTGASLA